MNSCTYILPAKTPQFIPVADKPLRLGGKIKRLAIDEFQRRFECTFNNGISLDREIKISPFRENITGDLSASQLKEQVRKILQTPPDNLVICDMGDFGYGLFTSTDIPKGTVIAVYAGTITTTHKASKEGLDFGYYGTNLVFSGKHHRGIASFLQHLPQEPKYPDVKIFSSIFKMFGQDVSEEQLKLNEELYSTEFKSSNPKELIAIENIQREYLDLDGIPVIALVANRNIKSGDQLGFNYGYDYWLSGNITPGFFDKQGNPLSRELYKRTFGTLRFDGFSYTGEYKPLVESLKKGKGPVKIIGDDKQPHDVAIGELACALLRVNACRLELHPMARQWVDSRQLNLENSQQ